MSREVKRVIGGIELDCWTLSVGGFASVHGDEVATPPQTRVCFRKPEGTVVYAVISDPSIDLHSIEESVLQRLFLQAT